MERANKVSQVSVINNAVVQELLSQCAIPEASDVVTLTSLAQPVPPSVEQPIRAVVAVDGSMREVSIRDEYPSATITFFAFGPVCFRLDALQALDHQPFIAPEDLARLKNIERYAVALPTRNISRNRLSLVDSIRSTLHDFFAQRRGSEAPFYQTLRWILFRQWDTGGDKRWPMTRCPNHGCKRGPFTLTADTPDVVSCDACRKPIYLVDACRLHERVDEEQGAGAISSYVLTLLEQVVLVDVIRAIWKMKPSLLREILFIKDGPLACFGQTASLSKPLREMAAFLGNQPDPRNPSARLSLLNLVGLEKSGPFVEHALQVQEQLPPASVLPLSNEYIYRYVVPGSPESEDPYGINTYWGGKLIFKAADGNTYVATVPTREGFRPTPHFSDFLNLTEVLDVVSELRCSMYDNALIPIALANRLVSLADVPSKRILETFARDSLRQN
jgi:hypothetical protein